VTVRRGSCGQNCCRTSRKDWLLSKDTDEDAKKPAAASALTDGRNKKPNKTKADKEELAGMNDGKMKEEYGETFADDGFRFSNPRPSRSLWAIEHY
jgi:hypothetical protein